MEDATHELGIADESAGRQTVDALAAKGLPMQKSWDTAGDDQVCEICRGNEAAGWIPLADPFPSGHQQPPGHVACRCCALYELDSEEAERLLDEPVKRTPKPPASKPPRPGLVARVLARARR